MFMTILIPLLIAVAGACMFGFLKNPKLVELGRLLFLAGMIATCMALIGETTSMGLGGKGR